jgi:NADH-quinone oxidoreductase subunit M
MALAGVLLLPVAAAVLVPFLRAPAASRGLAMAAMLAVLVLAASLFAAFDGQSAAGRFALDVPWIPSLGVDLRFGVTGFNVYLLLLTALLFPVVLACAWNTAEGGSRLYLCLMLALEAGLLGTFLARNLVILFVLWEAVLIPMVLLILVWGGPERRRAAMTFFLYTMAGSVLLLAAVILLGFESLRETGRWSFDLDTLYRLHLAPGKEAFVFVAIALACAVKSPLFPFHSWLPLAYGEASTSGTALMAGVLSKMGAFGFVALAIPLCPTVAPRFAPFMMALAVASILYGAVLALRQQHFKQLVAYASLSHMGYIVLGVFTFQAAGMQGALLQILSHGFAVAGLFLMLGMLERRCGPAYLELSALSIRAPRFAVVLMLFVLASLALPLSSGFVAEFLILLGAFGRGLANWNAGAGAGVLITATLACGGVVLGATYMLRFARVILYGDSSKAAATLPDLGAREGLALAPLLLLILWVGVWPASLMSKVEPVVAQLARPGMAIAATGTSGVAQAAQKDGALHAN